MKKTSTLFISILFVTALLLTGCGKKKTEEKNSIVGKWEQSGYIYTFNEDNSCSYDAMGTLMKCTYEIDGDKISIMYTDSTVPFETTYSIDGNKLNVIDSFGNDTIYTRK